MPHLCVDLTRQNLSRLSDGTSHVSQSNRLLSTTVKIFEYNYLLNNDPFLGNDLNLGGYILPKGTSVSIDEYSLNHNSTYWSEPNEFNPNRFSEVDDFTKKWCFFRFGFGGRRCPGQYYANLGTDHLLITNNA